jgi:hypothetical protein
MQSALTHRAMFDDITPLLKILFSNKAFIRQPVEFEWWLIRRKGRPFLLLPTSAFDPHVALQLYSAQRFRAKIMRALLPFILKTPAAFLFPRVRIRMDPASEMIQFMARQSGVPVEQVRAPAIKVGGSARFVMLLCGTANRPVKVLKVGLHPGGLVGLHPDGWEATEREANQLERLPPDLVGCIHMTGRLSTPAFTTFATTYFSGDSPRDDEGMEHLFHAWLNPHAPVPIESLHAWGELMAAFSHIDPQMWQMLSQSVAGKKVHSTIHHGDFAPWNIRAASQQNLQVFDWERGQAQGIPGWDWFHFFVQTAILARRYHEKRVAAEVEHLLQSPRFQVYAAAARIKDIIKPLFLAYLIHQKMVVKPVEGRETSEKLYELLAVRWGLKPSLTPEKPAAKKSLPGRDQNLLDTVLSQLKFMLSQLLNLVWEPTLSQVVRPSMRAQFFAHWKVIIANLLFFLALVAVQFSAGRHSVLHMSLIPFYLIPCLWLTLKLDRRWGALLATVAAVGPPLLRHLFNPDFMPLEITLWNMVMRFILFQIVVVLADRIRGQNIFSPLKTPDSKALFSDHWAAIIANGLFIVGVVVIDVLTSPQLNLLPLYLLPCMVLALTVGRRWGTAAAVITAIAGPFTQRFDDVYYKHLPIEFWNTVMRFLIFQAVVLILDRIRRENILFASHPPADKLEIPPAATDFLETNLSSRV